MMINQNHSIAFFNEIYDSLNRTVLIYITAKCGRVDYINDIFQEVWLDVYSVIKIKGKDYIKNPEAFVIDISTKKIKKHYSVYKRMQLLLPSIEKDETNDYSTYSDEDLISLEDSVANKLMAEQVLKYLESKSDETRKIFYLYYIYDLTIKEIVAHLSLTESNVKNKLYRTLNEIREIYE